VHFLHDVRHAIVKKRASTIALPGCNMKVAVTVTRHRDEEP
jgi:hypothetical protein